MQKGGTTSFREICIFLYLMALDNKERKYLEYFPVNEGVIQQELNSKTKETLFVVR